MPTAVAQLHLGLAWNDESVCRQVHQADVDLWIKPGIHRLLNRFTDGNRRCAGPGLLTQELTACINVRKRCGDVARGVLRGCGYGYGAG
ncbi:hypothetical protein PVS62_004531, partial [Salmonella enterica]|nr:hypothetical protein [Salmonella enterica]EKM8985078.1 hypothetical protein [Salmonella enterica]